MSIINALLAQALAPSIEEMEQQLQPVEGELEESVLEVVEAQGELSDQEEAVQRLETTAKSLEAFAIALEARVDASRPLIAGEAHAMRIGLEALLAPCGFSDKMISVGLEEFGEAPVPTEKEEEALQGEAVTVGEAPADAVVLSETEAMQASQEALDNVKATLLKFWEAIKAAVKKVVEMIKNFFVKIFGSVKGLSARASALAKNAAAAKNHKADDVKVSVPANVADLKGLGGTLAFSSAYADVVANSKALATKFYNDAKVAIGEVKAGKDAKAIDKAAGGDKEVKFPGGYVAKVTEAGVYEITAGGEKAAAEEKAPLSISDIETLGEGVVALAKVIGEKKSDINAIQDLHDGVLKAAEDLAKDAGKGFVGKTVDNAKARWAIKLSQKNFTGAIAKAASISLKGGYAAISVGEKMLKAYKAPEAKAAK